MKQRFFITLSCFIVIGIAGCRTQEKEIIRYDSPLSPGAHALQKITNPSDIPDLSLACLRLDGLREAALRSINYL